MFGSMCVLGTGGCAASHWEREYRAVGPAAPALSPTEPVRVREVPFDRIQATLTALTEKAALASA